jgi:hypothetical protein
MPLGAHKAAMMGTAGVSTGDVVLLSTQVASDSTVLTFNSGITSTYGEYIFKFYNINPETNDVNFTFQANATDSTSYNEYMTTVCWFTQHDEADSGEEAKAVLVYRDAKDQAQTQLYQLLGTSMGADADQTLVGELHLFNPATTTYVKHFYARMNMTYASDYTAESYVAGYINNTTAIDDVQFKMSADNFDGTIKMWGVK